MNKLSVIAVISLGTIACAPDSTASEGPAHERHELMEDVRDAAKPVGAMMKGEAEYDWETVLESLQFFADAGEQFGGLFPDGSEGGEAAPAIWEDREGFDAALVKWQQATAAAIAAEPASLDDAKPLLGEVFGSCKNCHDSYRIEE